jgi:hypothetical protein
MMRNIRASIVRASTRNVRPTKGHLLEVKDVDLIEVPDMEAGVAKVMVEVKATPEAANTLAREISMSKGILRVKNVVKGITILEEGITVEDRVPVEGLLLREEEAAQVAEAAVPVEVAMNASVLSTFLHLK